MIYFSSKEKKTSKNLYIFQYIKMNVLKIMKGIFINNIYVVLMIGSCFNLEQRLYFLPPSQPEFVRINDHQQRPQRQLQCWLRR